MYQSTLILMYIVVMGEYPWFQEKYMLNCLRIMGIMFSTFLKHGSEKIHIFVHVCIKDKEKRQHGKNETLRNLGEGYIQEFPFVPFL